MLLKEREYYKPFQYPWAFENYKKQQQMHWMPEEVNLHDDIRDYKEKLTVPNRRLIDNIFRFFTQADVDVAGGYAEHYLPTFKQPEVRMMLSAFASMEAVHMEAYALLVDTLGKNEDFYKEFMDIQEMAEKHEYLTNFNMDTPFDIAKTIAVYSGFTEGVQLFGSFAILLNYPRHNLMKGMGQIVTWSIRDESLHVEGMSQLFKTFVKENPDIWNDRLKAIKVCVNRFDEETKQSFLELYDKIDADVATEEESDAE